MFIINKVRVENLFFLLTDQLGRVKENNINSTAEAEGQDKAIEEARLVSIRPRNWFVIDILASALHLCMITLMSIPLLFLGILNELAYAPYSLKNPDNLVFNYDWNDPLTIIQNLILSSGWNLVVCILVFFTWAIMSIDLLFYYANMKFPQDIYFSQADNANVGFFEKTKRRIQWCLSIFSIVCYIGYICICLIWLMLGAILDPTSFLPLASSAVTFTVFVRTKYMKFKKLRKEGESSLLALIQGIFGNEINKTMKIMSEELTSVVQIAGNASEQLVESSAFQSIASKVTDLGLVDEETIEKIKQKAALLQSDPGKVADAAMNAAVAVARDPLVVLKEIDSLSDEMRRTTLKKVKDECEKRKIPGALVETFIQMSFKDHKKLKEAARKLMVDTLAVSENVKIAADLEEGGPKNDEEKLKIDLIGESADILSELLFPDSIYNQEFAMFIANKMSSHLIRKFGLSECGLDPVTFQKLLMSLSFLRGSDYETFGRLLEEAMNYIDTKLEKQGAANDINTKALSCMRPFWPSFNIIGVLNSCDIDKTWRLKGPILRLIDGVCSDAKPNRNVQKLLDFLNLVLTRFELPYSWDTEESALDMLRQKAMMDQFLDCSVLQKVDNKDAKRYYKLILDFAFFYIRQNNADMPNEVITMMHELLLPSKSNPSLKKIVPFSLQLTSACFISPNIYAERIEKSGQTFGINEDVKNFVCNMLKFLNRNSIKPEIFHTLKHNRVMKLISQKLKTPIDELLGLLGLIYNFDEVIFSRIFLESVMKRMDVDYEHYDLLSHLVVLYLSLNEEDVLKSLKRLGLEHGTFLLVSKGLFNPEYLSGQEWIDLEVGEKDPALKANLQISSHSHSDGLKWKEWTGKVTKSLTNNINEAKEDYKQQEANNRNNPFLQAKKDRLMRLRTINTYFGIKEDMVVTRDKILADLETFSNAKNKIADRIIFIPPEKQFAPMDVLLELIIINRLQLSLDPLNNKRGKLGKEQQQAITSLAKVLNISKEGLDLFLQLPMLGSSKEILQTLDYFLDSEDNDPKALKRFIEYSASQIEEQDKQYNFVSQELPGKLKIEDCHDFEFPEAIFKKLYMGDQYQLTINDVFEMISMFLKIAEVEEDKERVIFDKFKTLMLISKGVMSKTFIKNNAGVTNDRLLNILTVICEKSFTSRLVKLTECFKERKHPAKIFLAVIAYLTGNAERVKIRTNYSENNAQSILDEIRPYLSEVFDVHPELLDLFLLPFERDMISFCKAVRPIVRRITGQPLVDAQLFESIICLTFGEKFSSPYIAKKLRLTPPDVDLFSSMGRLLRRKTREEELNSLPTSQSFKKVCKEMMIEVNEFVGLYKIMLNLFTVQELSTLIKNLGVKEKIKLGYLQGLLQINRGITAGLPEKEAKANLEQFRLAITPFLFQLGVDENYSFIFVNLVSGAFTVLDFYSHLLPWCFPDNSVTARQLNIELAMALCGCVNYRVEVDKKMGKNIAGYILDDPNNSNASNRKKLSKTNSLAYAVYLLYKTCDIHPLWARLFFFDPKAYREFDVLVKKKTRNGTGDKSEEDVDKKSDHIQKELVLITVLNFAQLAEFYRDMMVLHEFLTNLNSFYLQKKIFKKGDPRHKCLETLLIALEQRIETIFENLFTFDWIKLQEFAKEHLFDEEEYAAIMPANPFETDPSVIRSLIQLRLRELDLSEQVRDKILDEFPKNSKYTCPKEAHKVLSQILSQGNSFTETYGQFLFQSVKNLFKAVCEKQKEYPSTGKAFKSNIFNSFSMLSSILFLRKKEIDKRFDYAKVIWHLDHLTTCIERRVIFDYERQWETFSKFRMMKLVAATVGFSYSSIVDFSLPDSLLKQKLVKALTSDENQAKRRFITQEYLERYVLENIINVWKKDEQKYNSRPEVGTEKTNRGRSSWEDIWVFNAETIRLIDSDKIKRFEGWDSIATYLSYDQQIFDNPELGNDTIPADAPQSLYPNFKFAETENKKYYSKEMINLAYDEQGEKKKEVCEAPPEYIPALNSTPSKEAKTLYIDKDGRRTFDVDVHDSEVKDLRTDLTAEAVKNGIFAFEQTLLNPNVEMIQGLLLGKCDVLLDKNNIIGSGDRDSAQIYHALLTLSSFALTRSKNKRKFIRNSIKATLSHYLESDPGRLEELLFFALTGRESLNQISNSLQIPTLIKDFLIKCITIKLHPEDTIKVGANDSEELEDFFADPKEQMWIFKDLLQESFGLDVEEAKTITCLINLRSGKRKEGWEPLLKSLMKNYDKSNQQYKKNFFYLLLKNLDLRKLEKYGCSNTEKNLTLFISHQQRKKEGQVNELFSTIYDMIQVESLPCLQETTSKNVLFEQPKNLRRLIRFVYNLLVGDRKEVFNIMFKEDSTFPEKKETVGQEKHPLGPIKKPSSQLAAGSSDRPECVIEIGNKRKSLSRNSLTSLLEEFEITAKDKLDHDVKMVRVLAFISLANSDQINNPENIAIRDEMISSIIKDKCFGLDVIENPELKSILVKLLFGILSWDLIFILESLKTETTYKAFLLFYSVIVLFNFKHTYKHKKGVSQRCLHSAIIILLKGVFKSIFQTLQTVEGDKFKGMCLGLHFKRIKEEGVLKKLDEMHNEVIELIKSIKTKNQTSTSRFRLLRDGLNSSKDQASRMSENIEEVLPEIVYQVFTGGITGTLVNLAAERSTDDPKADILNLIEFILLITEGFTRKTNNKTVGDGTHAKNNYDMLDVCTKEEDNAEARILNKIVGKTSEIITKEPFKDVKILKSLPDLIKTFFNFHNPDEAHREEIFVGFLKLLATLIERYKEEKKLKARDVLGIYLIGKVMSNYDINQLSDKNNAKQTMTIESKVNIIFGNAFLNKVFVNLQDKLPNKLIYNLMELLHMIYREYPSDHASKEHLQNVLPRVIAKVEEISIVPKDIAACFLGITQGDLLSCFKLLVILVGDKAKAEIMEAYLQQLMNMFDFKELTNSLKVNLSANAPKVGQNHEWQKLFERIRDGSASPSDLFTLADKEGDCNGSISLSEFKKITIRIGVDMTEHRIMEIFTKVKGNNQTGTTTLELNQQEFAKAITYIQNKNVTTAMQLLGISPEQLTLILIQLIIWLLLLLTFILLGIKAFAFGGTFGAVINSLFPAAGGFALSKRGEEDDNKLNKESIEDASKAAIQIVQSDQL